jgi:hypothetical protein
MYSISMHKVNVGGLLLLCFALATGVDAPKQSLSTPAHRSVPGHFELSGTSLSTNVCNRCIMQWLLRWSCSAGQRRAAQLACRPVTNPAAVANSVTHGTCYRWCAMQEPINCQGTSQPLVAFRSRGEVGDNSIWDDANQLVLGRPVLQWLKHPPRLARLSRAVHATVCPGPCQANLVFQA